MVLAEPSVGMHEVIAEKLAKDGPANVTAVRFDLLVDPPPPGDPFDLAVSLLVLHHLPDPAVALAAIGRLLRPGGRIALADLDTEDGTFHDADAEGIYHLGFGRDSLAESARTAGFADVEFEARPRSSATADAIRSSCSSLAAPDRMPSGRQAKRVSVSLETSPKKVFATAIDWPGWSRSGKTEELALEALAAYAARYAVVAAEAGEPFDPVGYDVVEQTDGGGGTAFGVPSAITALDRRPVTADEGDRLARIVEAA